jgi:hypothetical protein
MAVVLVLAIAPVAGYRIDFTGSPSVTVTDRVELSSAQPVVAVEFEASFVSLHSDSGIDGLLEPVRPQGRDLAKSDLEREVWDGEQWQLGSYTEIAEAGTNTFRFRWTLTLDEGAANAIVPIEAKFYPLWSGRPDRPLPGDRDVSQLRLTLVSIQPLESVGGG